MFGDAAPHGGGLLQAMARKAVDEVEIGQRRMRPQHGVLIERVIGIMADPVADHLDGIEARRTVPEGGPDDLFPQMQVGFEILGVAGAVIAGHGGGDPLLVFRPDPVIAVDHQGRGGDAGIRRVDDKDGALARFDGDVEARHAQDLRGAGACGIDGGGAGDVTPLPQRDAGDAACGDGQARDGIGDEPRAELAGRGAEAAEEAHIVEEAFIAGAETGTRQIIGVQPGKARGRFLWRKDFRRRAVIALQGREIGQRLQAFGGAGEEEIAVFAQGEVGDADIDAQMIGEVLDELDAVARDFHIHRVGELLADACRRQRGGGLGEGGIAFDDEDVDAGLHLFQPEGHGSAHDCPADHHDIRLHHLLPLRVGLFLSTGPAEGG